MEENISKKNKVRVILIALVILLASIIGVSYAYFSVQISGNEEASSMRLRTASMSLLYNDVQITSGEYVEPGWTDTKTLTVTNNGNVSVSYNIIWKDLINNIINSELVLSAECSASSGSCDDINEKAVPTKIEEEHNVIIKRNISIDPGVTHTYIVTTEFKDTGSRQNYNKGKRFRGTINIEEFIPAFTRVGTDSTTGLPVVRSVDHPTEEFYDLTNVIDYSTLISSTGNLYNYSANKSILLARYNLYVGQNCTSTSASSCTPISTSDSRYGLQSVDAKGYISSTSIVATVPLSGSINDTPYWHDSANNTIKSQYGTYTQYKNNIYDTNYVTAPDYILCNANSSSCEAGENYSIAYYVEGYVDRLGIEGTGRLLTYPEGNTMTKAQRTNGAYYWTGSAYIYNYNEIDYKYLLGLSSSGSSMGCNFDVSVIFGVRPVIVINTYDIKSAS